MKKLSIKEVSKKEQEFYIVAVQYGRKKKIYPRIVIDLEDAIEYSKVGKAKIYKIEIPV